MKLPEIFLLPWPQQDDCDKGKTHVDEGAVTSDVRCEARILYRSMGIPPRQRKILCPPMRWQAVTIALTEESRRENWGGGRCWQRRSRRRIRRNGNCDRDSEHSATHLALHRARPGVTFDCEKVAAVTTFEFILPGHDSRPHFLAPVHHHTPQAARPALVLVRYRHIPDDRGSMDSPSLYPTAKKQSAPGCNRCVTGHSQRRRPQERNVSA